MTSTPAPRNSRTKAAQPARTCRYCAHVATAGLFVETPAGYRCKSGDACRRRLRAREDAHTQPAGVGSPDQPDGPEGESRREASEPQVRRTGPAACSAITGDVNEPNDLRIPRCE